MPTSANIVVVSCKRTQHVGPSNVACCWPTILRPFAWAFRTLKNDSKLLAVGSTIVRTKTERSAHLKPLETTVMRCLKFAHVVLALVRKMIKSKLEFSIK